MKAIAAMASNRVIGKDGKLPWHIKGDLKFFKKMTAGNTMIMGSKTARSLPSNFNFGDRKLQILTHHGYTASHPDKLQAVNAVGDLDKSGWVCGGAEIYKLLLPLCTDLYLTRIFKSYEGDIFFPEFERQFRQHDVIERTDEYAIVHYKNIDPSVT